MQTKINDIKTKDQLIDYISNLIQYNKIHEINTFNDSYMVESLKDILFKSGFEIRNSYYNTLSEAFDSVVEFLKYNNVDDLNNYYDNVQIEADIYDSDILTWLAENVNNKYYCDEALKMHDLKSFDDILKYGQIDFKTEVYNMAFEIVEEIIKESQIVREGV